MHKHHFRKTSLPPCLQQVLTLHHTNMMLIRDQGRERPMHNHHFRKTFLPPCLQQVLTLHHTKVPLCLTQNICRTTVQANMSIATQITCQRRLTGYWVPMRMVSVIAKTRGRANGIMCERYPLHASTHRLVLLVYTYHYKFIYDVFYVDMTYMLNSNLIQLL